MKHISLRFQLVLCALILCVASLWAVPAKPGWQTKTQPDGTPVSVQLMGDEFCHYWMTQDGKIAKEQSDGTFIVMNEDIPTGEQVAQRRMASKRYQRRAKMVGSGTMPPRALFILVSFSNQAFKSTSETYYKSKLGETTEGAMSMYNYLKQQSNGKYAPPVDVYGPYTLSNTYATYGTNDSDGDDQDPAQMIVDACNAANADVDFSLYDGNKDGWVDNVYVLYAGKGEADGGAESTIWPHQWNITYGNKSLTVDGKKIGAYACSAELNGSSQCAMGTPLHEFGHVIGLPDYYDTEYKSTNYTESRTPGSWSIMDQGSYNNSGNTPPNYSIFDKYFLGWVTPKFLAKDEAANVTLTTDATDGYQITGGTSRVAATATSPATIYYIENRQKSGWDAYLPGHGMIVWQVKYNSSAWSGNTLNNTGGSPRYTVLSASGTETNIGKSTDPFPGTGKVKTWTKVTGCEMTDITESSGVITFKYNGGIDCHNVVVDATGCTIEPNSTCVENSTQLTATITPTDGTYDFTSLTVKRGSTTLTSGTHYTLSSDKKSLTIYASAISGSISDAITITAVWTKNRYKYDMLGENCTEETEELSGMLAKNAALNLTIAPASGYSLADASCWEVSMGGTPLTYGTDFTYNGSTNTFSIASVTGDLEIYAYGKHFVTWSADGSVHATNIAVDDKITLPSNPADCASGKKFVGWCTSSNYSHASTAPTFAKTGDAYSVDTYYAVYATPAADNAPGRAKAPEKATSISVGDEVILVCESKTMELSGFTTSGTIYGEGTSYTGTPAGTYSFSVVAGSANNSYAFVRDGKYWNWSSGNSLSTTTSISSSSSWTVSFSGSNATIANVGTSSRTIRWNSSSPRFACYTSGQTDVQLYKVGSSGGSGGSGSYTDYSTSCGTPCSQTPVMSFASATVAKTTADASFTQAVTITGKGSGQTVAYSSSDESIATVNASGAVTLKGKSGSTTITASVAADGDYCSASASYTLNVNAAPISVTLYYNNHTATFNNQTPPYTLPTTGDYVADMCDGDWTFAGWYGSSYDKSETAPTYITQLSATGSAYAVYTTTETVSSAPIRKTAAVVGDIMWSEDWTGVTNNTQPSSPSANGSTVYGSATITYSWTKGGTTTQTYTSGGPNDNENILVAKSNGAFTASGIPTGGATELTVTYATSGKGSITVSSSTENVSVSDNTISISDAGVTSFNLEFKNTSTSDNVRLDDIEVKVKTAGSGGGGGTTTTTTYYATTPECVTPCSNTPTMSFTNATVNKTTADASYTQTVNITGKGSGQTVAYSSSDVTVATVDNSGVVTLKGKVGSTTITASVEADGDYCAASASYTLNVTAAPIDVTLYYSGTSETLNDQTNPYTLPTTGKYVANMCDDAWTFAGWYSSEYAKSTQKPTYITELTTDGSAAYAVYKTTETSGSGGSATNLIEYNGVDGRSKLEAIEGVTTNSVADYAAANSPYLLKFDGTGDYIQFELSVVPTSLSFEYKMIGGGSTSTMTIMECATATGDYTDVEALSISGAQNSTGSLTTSNSFSKKYIRMVFTKGSNVGVGSITIVGGGSSSTTYYATTPDCAVTCNLTSITLNTTSAKKTFFVGEQFTYDGIVVTAHYNNCQDKILEKGDYGCVFPSDLTTTPGDHKTVTVRYTESGVTKDATYEITVICKLDTITLNTAGAKKTFFVGEQFTYDGIVVTAHYNSNNCANKTLDKSDYGCVFPSDMMTTPGTKQVTVRYTESNITKDATYEITVVVPYTVIWKACSEEFATQTYVPGAALELPSSTPGGNAGKSFVGWTATAHYTGASAPPDLFSTAGDKTVTGNVTYYAVYE